jgi:hypothetical protein
MYYLFVYVGYLFSLINLIVYIKSFGHFGKAHLWFKWYLGIVFGIQFISYIMMKLNTNNLFMSHFFFVGQLVLLGVFYENLMKTQKQKTFVKWGMGLGLLAITIQYIVDPSQFFQFNLFEIAITSLIVVVFALLHLYNMLSEKKEYYYVTLGIIIYLLASTVLFFAGNLSAGLSSELQLLTWTLNAFLVIVYQLFILFEWKKSFSKKAVKK